MCIATAKTAAAVVILTILWAASLAFAGAGQKDAPPKSKKDAIDEKAVRALIAELGDDSFDKREAAQKRLADIGEPARPLVQKAAKESADLEVRERAGKVLLELNNRARPVIYHDFQNKKFPEGDYRLYGPGVAKWIKREPEGLRFAFPAQQNKEAVGVAALFNIKGDFEITVGYELIQADQPTEGYGAGFEVYLRTNTLTGESLAFDRKIRPGGREVYAMSRMTTNQQGKRVSVGGQFFEDLPAAGKAGQLRISRIGSKAELSVAEKGGKGFRLVYSVDLGTEDISLLRLAANPGRAESALDVRLHDVRIRGTVQVKEKVGAP
ncbi:MAG TPA: DUF1583 domain-containing protein [Gemmataceae bacterium]|jgi:hypothetical protein|nr:DUF1583 domain-containing protein [Gemmataceae bacterium]